MQIKVQPEMQLVFKVSALGSYTDPWRKEINFEGFFKGAKSKRETGG